MTDFTSLVARADDAADDQNQGLSREVTEALMRIRQYGPYGYQPHLAGAVVFCIGA